MTLIGLTNVFVKPRTSPFTGGNSSLALRFGPLGGARRTQMSSALGVLPQCPRGLMLDCARHTSHCESNFGSFCRGCPTQRSRVPSSVSWVDSSRLRSCSVAASRLGFYLVSPPSSHLGFGPRPGVRGVSRLDYGVPAASGLVRGLFPCLGSGLLRFESHRGIVLVRGGRPYTAVFSTTSF